MIFHPKESLVRHHLKSTTWPTLQSMNQQQSLHHTMSFTSIASGANFQAQITFIGPHGNVDAILHPKYVGRASNGRVLQTSFHQATMIIDSLVSTAFHETNFPLFFWNQICSISYQRSICQVLTNCKRFESCESNCDPLQMTLSFFHEIICSYNSSHN